MAVCRSGYYQLRQLRPLIRSMSSDTVKMLVQAFISYCMDYCNSLFNSTSDGLMSRLQSVQNVAVRVHVSCQAFDGMTTLCRCYVLQ